MSVFRRLFKYIIFTFASMLRPSTLAHVINDSANVFLSFCLQYTGKWKKQPLWDQTKCGRTDTGRFATHSALFLQQDPWQLSGQALALYQNPEQPLEEFPGTAGEDPAESKSGKQRPVRADSRKEDGVTNSEGSFLKETVASQSRDRLLPPSLHTVFNTSPICMSAHPHPIS